MECIDIESKLPGDKEFIVAINIHNGDIGVYCWSHSTDSNDLYRQQTISHWLKLPTPPKKGEII